MTQLGKERMKTVIPFAWGDFFLGANREAKAAILFEYRLDFILREERGIRWIWFLFLLYFFLKKEEACMMYICLWEKGMKYIYLIFGDTNMYWDMWEYLKYVQRVYPIIPPNVSFFFFFLISFIIKRKRRFNYLLAFFYHERVPLSSDVNMVSRFSINTRKTLLEMFL